MTDSTRDYTGVERSFPLYATDITHAVKCLAAYKIVFYTQFFFAGKQRCRRGKMVMVPNEQSLVLTRLVSHSAHLNAVR